MIFMKQLHTRLHTLQPLSTLKFKSTRQVPNKRHKHVAVRTRSRLTTGNNSNTVAHSLPNLIIVINSNTSSEKALVHLIDSIKSDLRHKQYKIIVFIGGCYELPSYACETSENFIYIKCNFNSIDFTSFIGLSELHSNDVENKYLYLHDTCKVGNRFFDMLERIDLKNITSIRINKLFSNNIGFYSQCLINENKSFLQSIKTSKPVDIVFKKKIVEFEDIMFKNDKNNVLLDNYDDWQYTGPTDYYKTGTMRIVEYYPSLDLYKIKANWGQQWTINN